jgi:FtsH-binding integral membrane protein
MQHEQPTNYGGSPEATIQQPPMAQKQAQPLSINDNGVRPRSLESVPVVKVWSIRGVEYAIMTAMLFAVAISINWAVVALVNGSTGFVELSAPLALLIVSLPILAFFFMRLKKAELLNPQLKTESTKRRFSQVAQIVSFAVVFFALLGIVASLLAAVSGETEGLGKTIGTAFVFVVIWGGVFSYYWANEHRLGQ